LPGTGFEGDLADVRTFVADNFLGLEQVGQRGRDIPNFVAGRLLVPARQALVHRRSGAGLDLHVGANQRGALLPVLGEAEQPVSTYLFGTGDGDHILHAREPIVAGGQELRKRGPVHAHSCGERRARLVAALDQFQHPGAERFDSLLTVHKEVSVHLRIKHGRDIASRMYTWIAPLRKCSVYYKMFHCINNTALYPY